MRTAPLRSIRRSDASVHVAYTYVALSLHDDAMNCPERAVDKSFGHKEWIDHDSDFDVLRSDLRFQALLQAM